MHGPDAQTFISAWGKQCLEFVLGRGAFPKPLRPVTFVEDHRHPVVKRPYDMIGLTGDDGAAFDPFAGWRLPFVPEPGHHHQIIICHPDCERLSVALAPLVEAVRDHEAALTLPP